MPSKYFFLIIALLSVCGSQLFAQDYNKTQSINGISFIGPYQPPYDQDALEKLASTGANWVAFIPEAVMDRRTLQLKAHGDDYYWGSTREALIQGIALAKDAGLKVFVKPHIVLEKLDKSTLPKNEDKTKRAEWRGDFKARNDGDWKIWEQNYHEYIIDLAQLADSLQVDMFCVGTEMREFVKNRPGFWQQLITEIRTSFRGALTYSANWDEYNYVTFWNRLDYIGIDAYFPIIAAKTPKVRKAIRKWRPTKRKLKALSESMQRPILFTEYGYRSVDNAGKTPWIHDHGGDTPNNDTQVNLMKALYKTFWDEDWIAGGFLWNWLHHVNEPVNADFTVQYKPALELVKEWYK